MRFILLISLIIACSTSILAQRIGKKVQFVGAARTLMSYSDFRSEESDTVTAPTSFGGYGLIDLGIKINLVNSRRASKTLLLVLVYILDPQGPGNIPTAD